MKSILKEKSHAFGVSVALAYQSMKEKKRNSTLLNQFLRSGTSVGALISEAQFAQSRADFINKLSVALKEANETEYWLHLLNKTGEIDGKEFLPLAQSLTEIISMLVSSVRTAKGNVETHK